MVPLFPRSEQLACRRAAQRDQLDLPGTLWSGFVGSIIIGQTQVPSCTCDASETSFPLCRQQESFAFGRRGSRDFRKKASVSLSSAFSQGHTQCLPKVTVSSLYNPAILCPSRSGVRPLRCPPPVRIRHAQHLCCVPVALASCEQGPRPPPPSTPGLPWTLLSKHNLILFPFFPVVTINLFTLAVPRGSWNMQPPLCLQLSVKLMIIDGCFRLACSVLGSCPPSVLGLVLLNIIFIK